MQRETKISGNTADYTHLLLEVSNKIGIISLNNPPANWAGRISDTIDAFILPAIPGIIPAKLNKAALPLPVNNAAAPSKRTSATTIRLPPCALPSTAATNEPIRPVALTPVAKISAATIRVTTELKISPIPRKKCMIPLNA